MKDGIAIVYTGAHEEIRSRIGDREVIAKRNGEPITVPAPVAVELIGRGEWKCSDSTDAKDVAEAIEAAKPKKAPATKTPGTVVAPSTEPKK